LRFLRFKKLKKNLAFTAWHRYA